MSFVGAEAVLTSLGISIGPPLPIGCWNDSSGVSPNRANLAIATSLHSLLVKNKETAMLPFEEENRAEIRRRFDAHFQNCQAMVNFAQCASDALLRQGLASGLRPRTMAVLVSMVVRETRKLRAVSILCERGFVGEAEQLVRSLLDGAVAARFVCRDPVAADKRPAGIRDPKYPLIPTNQNPIDFRSHVYASHILMQKYRAISDPDTVALAIPPETIQSIEASAKQFIADVGEEWADRVGGIQGYARMGVKDLAGNYELLSLYRLYKDISNRTHANDAFAGVHCDLEGSVTVMWCGKGDNQVAEVLKLGAAFLADTCRSVMCAIGLPALGDEAYMLAQNINQIP
jgi:hypothetical protein